MTRLALQDLPKLRCVGGLRELEILQGLRVSAYLLELRFLVQGFRGPVVFAGSKMADGTLRV